jgi:DNA (cytosine-5)-methyltransferase 1
MTFTATDLFCGAGGSSLGAEAGGATLVMAANHWQTAIDVHQQHFPNAGHDCADVSQADPRRYPKTNLLIASPECTNHSQARGVSRKAQQPTFFDAPDPTAERSRATMWDVVRFAEQLRYEAVIVENVVEATKWVLFGAWWQAMTDLGYTGRTVSMNSMFHGVPQSRDRIYVVWTRKGIRPDLDLELPAWCPRCSAVSPARQVWKEGRRTGRYRQQWLWRCSACLTAVEPTTQPAATIIDWDLPCPRIGDRAKPLAANTRDRIYAGLQRYGWAPIITAGAGHVHERTPGNRARGVDEPLPAQQATASSALALAPDGFLYQTAHGGRVTDLASPHPTVCGSDDRQALVLTNRSHSTPRPVDDPLTTLCAGGNHHALIMRNNRGGAEMVTPADEPIRTLTSKCSQSLLLPYNGTGGRAVHAATEPIGTVIGSDRWSKLDPASVVDDCGFRMLEPQEVAAAMAFPDGYIPTDLSKKDRVKLAGNAVTPPVMRWLTGRVLQALEAA